MPMLPRLIALSVVPVALAVPLAAQCPDGSPPPCRPQGTRLPPAPNSVAVLYFDNLSRDTADAYLADGLTEEIIIRLGQVQRLEVKSRFEVQRYRGHALPDPPALGRSLDAAYLLTGSVQRAGDQVRLRAELVRAANRAQVWGDVFDRNGRNLLTVESDIAGAVATAIAGHLLPEERTRLTRPITADPIAYEEYLRGVQARSNTFDEPSIRSALTHFARAIARDSGFAAAYAGQAQEWEDLADGYIAGREGYARAAAAARQAIARDSLLALPYAMLSSAALALDFDGREAERLARRAVTLDPRRAEAHGRLSDALWAAGRSDEALLERRRAWELDSLSVDNGYFYIEMLLFSHQLDSAAAFLPRYRRAAPAPNADLLAGRLLAALGDLRDAAPLLNWRRYGGQAAGTYVRALVARGDTLAARATLDSMLAARASGYFNPLAIARAYVALGDIDRGMEWLQRAFEERTLWLTFVRVDDELAPLRADPRYAALDQQLKY
jgi:adenylate cyclase